MRRANNAWRSAGLNALGVVMIPVVVGLVSSSRVGMLSAPPAWSEPGHARSCRFCDEHRRHGRPAVTLRPGRATDDVEGPEAPSAFLRTPARPAPTRRPSAHRPDP